MLSFFFGLPSINELMISIPNMEFGDQSRCNWPRPNKSTILAILEILKTDQD